MLVQILVADGRHVRELHLPRLEPLLGRDGVGRLRGLGPLILLYLTASLTSPNDSTAHVSWVSAVSTEFPKLNTPFRSIKKKICLSPAEL